MSKKQVTHSKAIHSKSLSSNKEITPNFVEKVVLRIAFSLFYGAILTVLFSFMVFNAVNTALAFFLMSIISIFGTSLGMFVLLSLYDILVDWYFARKLNK
jgi:hypothetical protein